MHMTTPSTSLENCLTGHLSHLRAIDCTALCCLNSACRAVRGEASSQITTSAHDGLIMHEGADAIKLRACIF